MDHRTTKPKLMPKRSLTNKDGALYGNYLVVSPDDEPMFRCNRKKIDNYISLGLAEWIDETTARLTFEPYGKGHYGDKFHLQERDNICVCCGAKEDLTKHHVFPIMYRRHIDETIKQGDNHDILPLCIQCHLFYEHNYADKLKSKIAEETGIPLHGDGIILRNNPEYFASRNAHTLIRYGDGIPDDCKESLIASIMEWFGHAPSQDELEDLAAKKVPNQIVIGDFKPHGLAVVERLDDDELHQFMIRWRRDFIDNMKPKFMPNYWDINHRLTSKPMNPLRHTRRSKERSK